MIPIGSQQSAGMISLANYWYVLHPIMKWLAMPLFIHPSALSFQLFGISVYDYRIRRYCITATPLLAEGYQFLSSVLLENYL